MICYPNAKINIGLNVISKRIDGFHNLESVVIPIPLYDILEVIINRDIEETSISYSGYSLDNNKIDLVIRAYNLIKNDFKIPSLKIHLHKIIPIYSGLGGGSSDAVFMLKLLNNLFNLKISNMKLLKYANLLGSDCPFFVLNKISQVSGRGADVKPLNLSLSNYKLVIIKPPIECSTIDIFNKYVLKSSEPLIVTNKVESWRGSVKNNLESVCFDMHPEIANIKKYLYSSGAIYASMSGSGSSVYAFFKKNSIIKAYKNYWFKSMNI